VWSRAQGSIVRSVSRATATLTEDTLLLVSVMRSA